MSSSSSKDAFHVHADVNEAYLAAVVPKGFVFKPNDREILAYLSKKISTKRLPPNRIKSVNLYEYDVDTLIEKYKAYGEDEWYFFTPRDKKHRKGHRPSRTAGEGYWKATSGVTNIYKSKTDKTVIGYKMVLNYYYGKCPKGVKTNWIMHEYVLSHDPNNQNSMQLNEWVLCSIHRANYTRKNSSSPSTSNENKQMKTRIDVGSSSSSPSLSAYPAPSTQLGGSMLEANHDSARTPMLPMSTNMIINGSSSAATTFDHEQSYYPPVEYPHALMANQTPSMAYHEQDINTTLTNTLNYLKKGKFVIDQQYPPQQQLNQPFHCYNMEVDHQYPPQQQQHNYAQANYHYPPQQRQQNYVKAGYQYPTQHKQQNYLEADYHYPTQQQHESMEEQVAQHDSFSADQYQPPLQQQHEYMEEQVVQHDDTFPADQYPPKQQQFMEANQDLSSQQPNEEQVWDDNDKLFCADLERLLEQEPPKSSVDQPQRPAFTTEYIPPQQQEDEQSHFDNNNSSSTNQTIVEGQLLSDHQQKQEVPPMSCLPGSLMVPTNGEPFTAVTPQQPQQHRAPYEDFQNDDINWADDYGFLQLDIPSNVFHQLVKDFGEGE